jgi:hypothetical protein
LRHVTTGLVSTAGNQAIQGAEAAQQAARDWEAVRASKDIQFAPIEIKPPQQPQVPEWLQAIGRFLKAIFEPIGHALGMSWSVLQWVLIAIAASAVLYLVWRIVEPLLSRPRKKAAAIEPDWTPERAAALALLEDADRLAAEGKFDEATHLLLQRSVQQIAAVRPDWLHPASTAREIAVLSALPEAARRAFGIIATRVEASRYALRRLAAPDWQAARQAYDDFALVGVVA